MTLQNWTQTSDGNYSGSATADGMTVTATTRATTNETGAACAALDVTVTRGGVTQTFTALGTFFRAQDWGTLADRYVARALAGRTGDDIYSI